VRRRAGYPSRSAVGDRRRRDDPGRPALIEVDDTEVEAMERKRISSSKIRAAGYDARGQVLEIEFSDGRVMAYSGVSPEIQRQFMNAPSPVSFFDDKIADDYPARRIK
jgi:KTSC domain